MCDFSQYGTPSKEWLAVEAKLSAPPQMDLIDKKRVTNTGREAIAAAEMKDLVTHVAIQDFTIPTRDEHSIEARSYFPVAVPRSQKLPLYIHLHGGGFLFGSLASEDAICARIAVGAGVVVLNVNYRHTPEYVFPTAWLDVQDAFIWAHSSMEVLGAD